MYRGIVWVSPGMLPAIMTVAPNSPRPRANASTAPAMTPRRASGRVTRSVVCAGPALLAASHDAGGVVIPVDSEHSAIFQVLQPAAAARVARLILTASGGPFRSWSLQAMSGATPEQAVAHPNWNMGAKISVDSATMMNKGLEMIEAAYLFATPESKLEVLVHPQSVVHSLVEYQDGSTLAQLAVILSLGASLHAVGQHASIATLITVNTLAAIIGGAVPAGTPPGAGTITVSDGSSSISVPFTYTVLSARPSPTPMTPLPTPTLQ